MMRIITGKARGGRLATLEGEATRPTSERAKEAVFSVLQFEISGRRVLDLFAGSGQLGLEALSRGASSATFCDASRDAVRIIRTNAERTRLLPQCEIECREWEALLRMRRGRDPYGLILLDPPYAMHVLPRVLETLLEYGLCTPDARIVCESAEEGDVFGGDERLAARFEILRAARYGAAYVTILSPKKEN